MAATTEYNVQELAPQLFWTIAVGYMLRSLEVGLLRVCEDEALLCSDARAFAGLRAYDLNRLHCDAGAV